MSVAPPPSENLPIFNPDVFELDDSNISLSQADARYYKKTGGIISGSATIAGTTNLLSTTNISGIVNISNSTQSTASTNGALVVSGGLGVARDVYSAGIVNISNSTQSTASTNGALVVSGGLGVARDVYSAGIVNISNSTQSTAPTNGALVVSGGLGVARNSHFNGTVHVPVGTAAAPTFSFVADPNTGIFQNGADVVGITAGGSLRVSHSATTSTFSNIISLPLGSVSAAALNFGTANTGLFSSGANSLNFTVAGSQRLDITNARIACTLPIQLSAGGQTAPQIYFSTSTQTGFYLPNSNQIGITVAGTLRQTIDASRMITNIPIRLPNDGTNFSDFGYYEVASQVMIMRISATQTFNWNVALVRIGSTVLYGFSDDVNLYTIANGPRAIQSETNTIPSRYRPSSNQASSYLYLDGTPTWNAGKILINADGTLSITPLNGNFATGNTIYIQRHSLTIFV